MTDDELIERVRRALQSEAAAITPRPEGQPAEPYSAPVRRLPFRPRWPLVVVAAATVAAGVTLVALNWPGGSSRIGLVGPGPSTSVAPTTVPATRAPATTLAPVVGPVPSTLPSPAVTVPIPTTVPAPTPLKPSFAPDAVTFVSPSDGWLVGTAWCGSASCLAMAQTTDGGYTWNSAPAPIATVAAIGSGTRAVSVRFANHQDGWIYALNPSRVWSTHDGGAHWTLVPISGLASAANSLAMEAGDGYVRIAVVSATTDTVHVESSPVGVDAWTDTDTGIPVGAGPVPTTQLVLQGTAGWVLENDRTVVGAARLDSAGEWTSWTPPCQTAKGTASLAASSATDMAAVCQEGVWGPAGNLPAGTATPSTWLFGSSDGGLSSQAVGALPSTLTVEGAASPSPPTVVVDGSLNGSNTPAGVVSASFDGGHTWQTVLQAPANLAWFDLGFTTQTQGVLIGSSPAGSTFYMTRDGGHHWAPVRL
jgi:hypothetical protein